MRALVSPLIVLALLATTSAARADSVDENPDAGEECTMADQCPETGVACREVVDACWSRYQCPERGADCHPSRGDVETCRRDATAAGLELRCEADGGALYCAPGEISEEAACHDMAREDGLEARCVDRTYSTIYCGPAEDEPGCAVETVGRQGAGRGALAVLVIAAVGTLARAARRRPR